METLPIVIKMPDKLPYYGNINRDIDAIIIDVVVDSLLKSEKLQDVSRIYGNIRVYIWKGKWIRYDIEHLQRHIQGRYIDTYDNWKGV